MAKREPRTEIVSIRLTKAEREQLDGLAIARSHQLDVCGAQPFTEESQ